MQARILREGAAVDRVAGVAPLATRLLLVVEMKVLFFGKHVRVACVVHIRHVHEREPGEPPVQSAVREMIAFQNCAAAAALRIVREIEVVLCVNSEGRDVVQLSVAKLAGSAARDAAVFAERAGLDERIVFHREDAHLLCRAVVRHPNAAVAGKAERQRLDAGLKGQRRVRYTARGVPSHEACRGRVRLALQHPERARRI